MQFMRLMSNIVKIKRNKIKICPLCGSGSIEYILGTHKSKIHGTAYNVTQTLCHNCGETFLGSDSLEVIRFYEHHLKKAGSY